MEAMGSLLPYKTLLPWKQDQPGKSASGARRVRPENGEWVWPEHRRYITTQVGPYNYTFKSVIIYLVIIDPKILGHPSMKVGPKNSH